MDRLETAAAGFLRDTLVFRTGTLARTALCVAFSDPRMQAVYAAWLSAQPKRAVPAAAAVAESEDESAAEYRTLMEAGMIHDGTISLQARKQPEEFVLTCEHASFKLVVCVAFAPRTAHLHGFHVCSFSGRAHTALAWLEATASCLQHLVRGAADDDRQPPPRERMN